MAKENDSSSDEDEEVYDIYSFDELQKAFDELSSKFEELGSRHIALKKKFSKLETKVKALKSENEFLLNHKCALKKSVDDFSLIATKLTKGKENFGFSKIIFVQAWLRLYSFHKKKIFKNSFFVKQGFSTDDECSYCGLTGHYACLCKLREPRFVGIKWIWLQKEQSYPT